MSERSYLMEDWYNRNEVKYKVIKYLFNREFALILPYDTVEKQVNKNIRMLRVHNVESLSYLLNKGFRIFEKGDLYNLYYSLAKFQDGIPYQNISDMTQRTIDNWKFIENFNSEMVSYDFVIDIDAKGHYNMSFAVQTAVFIYELFTKFNIPIDLRFSGCGFHFVVENKLNEIEKYSLDNEKDFNIYNFFAYIAKILNRNVSEMIDYRIYDKRRVLKVPFSLANYKNAVYVCTPIYSLEALKKFDLKNYTPTFLRGKIASMPYIFNAPCKNENFIKMYEYLKELDSKRVLNG
jgi:hypothetical protein